MSDFSLGELIRATLNRSRESDPGVLARRIVVRIPDEHVREALADCLRDRVRIEIGRQRMRTPSLLPMTVGRSWRAEARAALSQRHFVPGVGWKTLGACTADDCDLIVAEHARRSVESAELADRFRRYAALLRASTAATLADLGVENLERAA